MNTIKSKRNKRTDRSRQDLRSGFAQRNGQVQRKKQKSSILDTNQLIKKATSGKEVVFESDRLFTDMPLDERLKNNLIKKGFQKPSQIQDKTLESLKSGRNLIGIANTGTGKTAAFLIPIIERLLKQPESLTALVIVPTRELALQVEQEFRSLTLGMNFFGASFIGGTSVNKDLSKLRRQNHILIGTPGRLKDLIDQKALHLRKIPVLVLDEFDRMLDMGFVRDIKRIIGGMTSRQQTMLFSATKDKTQDTLISQLLKDPVVVKVSSGTTSSDRVQQDIIQVPQGADKFKMLADLISKPEFSRVLVFAETKRWVDRVAKQLNQSGINADQIHGNKSQNYRNCALEKFKKGRIQVLVATDVAARGIDVTDVTHVINYQLPMSFDSYIHRIGRTGRAGKIGKAFTFVN